MTGYRYRTRKGVIRRSLARPSFRVAQHRHTWLKRDAQALKNINPKLRANGVSIPALACAYAGKRPGFAENSTIQRIGSGASIRRIAAFGSHRLANRSRFRIVVGEIH